MNVTKYKLLVESEGKFVPALDDNQVQITFEAEIGEEASAILQAYQAENGKCFAAEAIGVVEVAES
mgnify:FL=1